MSSNRSHARGSSEPSGRSEGSDPARAGAAALLVPAALLLPVALLLPAGLAGCAPPEDTAWRRDIEAVLTMQAERWNRGDIPGYMEGYWKSDSLVFTSGGRIRRGWTATLEKYRATYDTPEKMGRLEFSNLEMTRVADGAAVVLGRWELERAGDRPGGVFSIVLRKFPEGWRVVHDHTSSDPP